MASFPPSHPGSDPLTAHPTAEAKSPKSSVAENACRRTFLAPAGSLAPIRWARGRRRAYPAEEPCGRRHQPDGCRGVCPEASDHRGVDVEHHDDGQLCQNGGNAQPDDQVEPLAPGHRLAGADQLQQFVFSLFSCIHRRSAVKTAAKIVFFIGPALFAAVPAPRQASFADRRCSGG